MSKEQISSASPSVDAPSYAESLARRSLSRLIRSNFDGASLRVPISPSEHKIWVTS